MFGRSQLWASSPGSRSYRQAPLTVVVHGAGGMVSPGSTGRPQREQQPCRDGEARCVDQERRRVTDCSNDDDDAGGRRERDLRDHCGGPDAAVDQLLLVNDRGQDRTSGRAEEGGRAASTTGVRSAATITGTAPIRSTTTTASTSAVPVAAAVGLRGGGVGSA